jgi:predicted nucleotidyltransferase
MPTAAQENLVAAISAVLDKDVRVEAAWLAGSLGRGKGDVFSDVDVLVLCADGLAGDVSAAIANDPSRIAKTVLVNSLYGGRVLNFVVEEDWQRFDLSFIEGAQLSSYNAADLAPLFNRSGREPPRTQRRPYVTTPETVAKLVREFFRILALAPVGLGREEYLVALWGIDLLRRLTVDLMLEENGVGPSERGGALHLNQFLTEQQRRELESLPPLTATRDSLLAADQAIAAIFLPRARTLAGNIGMVWPEALEVAARKHLRAQLGLKI